MPVPIEHGPIKQEHLLSQHAWDAAHRADASGHLYDKLSVHNLSATTSASHDAWGRQKQQPVFISLTVSMSARFECSDDSLDNSTIHYGILSKSIIGAVEAGYPSQFDRTEAKDVAVDKLWLARLVEQVAFDVAPRREAIAAVEIELFFPKASLLGGGVGFRYSRAYPSLVTAATLQWRNIRVPTLIGLNPNERLAKQMVVLNMWLDSVCKWSDLFAAGTVSKFDLCASTMLGDSAHETLEALAVAVSEAVLADTNSGLLEAEGESTLRLKLEKPIAVPFADAPAIEICRKLVEIKRGILRREKAMA